MVYASIPNYPLLKEFCKRYNDFWVDRDSSDIYFNFHIIFKQTALSFPHIKKHLVLDSVLAHKLQHMNTDKSSKEFRNYVDRYLNNVYIYKLKGTMLDT